MSPSVGCIDNRKPLVFAHRLMGKVAWWKYGGKGEEEEESVELLKQSGRQ